MAVFHSSSAPCRFPDWLLQFFHLLCLVECCISFGMFELPILTLSSLPSLPTRPPSFFFSAVRAVPMATLVWIG